jgi:hypothetical protein
MLSVQLPGNVRPDQLSEDLFLEWLRMIPAAAECIKVEAGWASLPTLIIVSVPMSIWKYIEEHPAIRLVGIIQSPNLLAPKQVELREVIASMSAPAENSPQEKKGKGVEAIASTSAPAADGPKEKKEKGAEVIPSISALVGNGPQERMEQWRMQMEMEKWRMQREKVQMGRMKMERMERMERIERMERMERIEMKRMERMEKEGKEKEMEAIPGISAAVEDGPQKGGGIGKLVTRVKTVLQRSDVSKRLTFSGKSTPAGSPRYVYLNNYS